MADSTAVQPARTRLLAVGDMHLGREPARLPEDRPAISLGPRVAWQRTVEHAMEVRAEAVLLAGDVVESDNEYFEAYGPLAAGVRRLTSAGVTVLAVAGNHDVEVLPRLAQELERETDRFRLLGAGGRWEEYVVGGSGGRGRPVRVVGWSFPSRRVTGSPLASAPPESDLPTVGLLHADLDVGDSPYAPVRRAELEAQAGVDAWLLGHIHGATLDPDDARPLGYLGSLSPLDPTETGPHGPWLVEFDAGGAVHLEQVVLAPLRWERVDVDVSGLGSADELENVVTRALSALREQAVSAASAPDAAGLRIRLIGRTQHRLGIGVKLAQWRRGGWPFDDSAEPLCFVDRIDDAVRDVVDLERRAAADDPVGRLARRLLVLEGGDEAARATLLQGARAELATALRTSVNLSDEHVDLSDAALRERLLSSGWELLHRLEASRAEARPAGSAR